MIAAVQQIQGELQAKEEELTATRAEYDQKKKEVGRGRVGGWERGCGCDETGCARGALQLSGSQQRVMQQCTQEELAAAGASSGAAWLLAVHPTSVLPSYPPPLPPPKKKQCQVAIIRQVEVDIANEIELMRANHKEERSKAKLWGGKAREAAAAIAERDGAWGGLAGGCFHLLRQRSVGEAGPRVTPAASPHMRPIPYA